MRFKIIVVEPRYQINLGYIARVSKNFGIRKLFLVKPRTKIGKRAIMFSKHAHRLLSEAKIYNDFKSAIRDCDVVIGTTGIWRKGHINFDRTMLMEDAISKVSGLREGKTVGIVIGRDDMGLRKEEVERCDIVAYIGTDPEYPVLNISHALAIMLYLLTRSGFRASYKDMSEFEKADKKEMQYLLDAFDAIASTKKIRNMSAVRNAFRRMIKLSQPNRQEVHALITALK